LRFCIILYPHRNMFIYRERMCTFIFTYIHTCRHGHVYLERDRNNTHIWYDKLMRPFLRVTGLYHTCDVTKKKSYVQMMCRRFCIMLCPYLCICKFRVKVWTFPFVYIYETHLHVEGDGFLEWFLCVIGSYHMCYMIHTFQYYSIL